MKVKTFYLGTSYAAAHRLWYIYSFIHSTGMCRMQPFLAVLRSFFHSSLLRTFSCHPSPPTILPSSLFSSCHLFLGLPLSLVVPKFIHNSLLGITFSSILCRCPNQRNLFNLIMWYILYLLTFFFYFGRWKFGVHKICVFFLWRSWSGFYPSILVVPRNLSLLICTTLYNYYSSFPSCNFNPNAH